MKFFQLPSCPYCNKKMNIIATWAIRREGEFRCPRCRGVSNIMLDIKLALIAVASVILSALLFVILRIISQNESIGILILCISPILIFYISSVFFLRLRKPVMKKKRRRVPKQPERETIKEWADTNEIESTKIN